MIVLLILGLLLLNWWSPIGIRLASSNLNLLIFMLAAAAAPVSIMIAARSFTPVIKWIVWVLAGALHVPVFFVLWFVAAVSLSDVSHGREVEPLVKAINTDSGRIAVYESDSFFSGPELHLRLERSIFPGVFLTRDLAFVGAPDLEKLVMLSPSVLCLSFMDSWGLPGTSIERQATQTIQPLLTWAKPTWLDTTATPVEPGTACHRSN